MLAEIPVPRCTSCIPTLPLSVATTWDYGVTATPVISLCSWQHGLQSWLTGESKHYSFYQWKIIYERGSCEEDPLLLVLQMEDLCDKEWGQLFGAHRNLSPVILRIWNLLAVVFMSVMQPPKPHVETWSLVWSIKIAGASPVSGSEVGHLD